MRTDNLHPVNGRSPAAGRPAFRPCTEGVPMAPLEPGRQADGRWKRPGPWRLALAWWIL